MERGPIEDLRIVQRYVKMRLPRGGAGWRSWIWPEEYDHPSSYQLEILRDGEWKPIHVEHILPKPRIIVVDAKAIDSRADK